MEIKIKQGNYIKTNPEKINRCHYDLFGQNRGFKSTPVLAVIQLELQGKPNDPVVGHVASFFFRFVTLITLKL
jgi:hypothetical protein